MTSHCQSLSKRFILKIQYYMDNTKLADAIATKCYAKFLAKHYDNDPENAIFDIENAISDAALSVAEAKDEEYGGGERRTTLSEKYASVGAKSLKQQLLEAVEAKLQKAKPGEPFRYSIGWYECGWLNCFDIPDHPGGRFDALTNEGSKGEINAIMEAEGFKVIDSFGIPGSLRPNTTYVLER